MKSISSNRSLKWSLRAGAFSAALAVSLAAHATVNVNNGNFYVLYTDFLVPTPGLNIDISRTYNSRSNHAKGYFGVGWASELDSYLSFDGKAISYHEGGGGNLVKFTPTAKGGWENGVFGPQTLDKAKGGGYVLHTTFAKDLHFDDKGKLTRIADRNKNGIDLIYKDGMPVLLKDNFNNQIKVKWADFGGAPRITLLEMGEKKARYEYSPAGDLVRASGMDGVPYTYAYDDQHNMTKIGYQNGQAKEMTYNKTRDWITSFKDRDGILNAYEYYADKLDPENKFGTTLVRTQEGSKDRDVSKYWYEFRRRADGSRYNYRAVTWMRGMSTETIFTECCGTPQVVSQWMSDEPKESDSSQQWTVASPSKKSTFFEYYPDGLLKKKTMPDGIVTELTYDSKHKKVASVSRDGHQLQYNYDDRGNLAWALDVKGGRRIDLTYDLKGRITVIQEKITGSKEPKLVYFRYNAAGKPVEIKEKSGPFSGSIRVAYSPNGEVSSILNAAGRSVASEREVESVRRVASTFQNLLELVQPAGVSLTPEG